jgi:hypothetical protein
MKKQLAEFEQIAYTTAVSKFGNIGSSLYFTECFKSTVLIPTINFSGLVVPFT